MAGFVDFLPDVVDFVSNVGSNLLNQESNRSARAFAAAEAQKSRDWQERMYRKYMSPQGQLEQGVNPYLSPSASSMPSASGGAAAPSSLPVEPFDMTSRFSQISQSRLLDSEAELNRIKAQSQLQLDMAQIDVLLANKDLSAEQKAELQERKRLLQKQIGVFDEVHQSDMATAESQRNESAARINSIHIHDSIDVAMHDLNKRVTNEQINKIAAEVDLLYKQGQFVDQQKMKSIAEEYGVWLSNDEAEMIMPYKLESEFRAAFGYRTSTYQGFLSEMAMNSALQASGFNPNEFHQAIKNRDSRSLAQMRQQLRNRMLRSRGLIK